MSKFYNKQGEPISIETWQELRKDLDYRVIGNDFITDPNGFEIRVSTIWLGLDAAWHPDVLQLFESMVFNEDGGEITSTRYETLADAKHGHFKLIEQVENGGLL